MTHEAPRRRTPAEGEAEIAGSESTRSNVPRPPAAGSSSEADVRPEEQTVAEWLVDYDREPDPDYWRRGLRLPPLPERYRDPVSPAEHLTRELRAELEVREALVDELADGYGAFLIWTASLVARTVPDDALEPLLADEPLGHGLPPDVVVDLRRAVEVACQLAERAEIRPASGGRGAP